MRKKKILSLVLTAAMLLTGLPAAYAADIQFTDTQGHWAEEHINRATELGLFAGVSDTEFQPDGTLTRAMFVCVLAKYNGYDPSAYSTTKFNDVPDDVWCTAAVAWASENGVVAGTSSTTFSPNQIITREQIAVMLVNYCNAVNIILPRIREANMFADSAACADFALDAVYTLYRSGIINGVPGNKFDPKGSATRAECAAIMCNYIDSCSSDYADSEKVTMVNHRGYSAQAPENTLPAYELAAQMGYTYVETDVQFTKDGVPVLLHDVTIDRTSNGSGNVSDLTYKQLLEYDFGSWKSPQYAGTQIATFEEFIALCVQYGLHPYIELKSVMTANQVNELLSIVKNYNMLNDVTWISFYYNDLNFVKTSCRTAELMLLVTTVSSSGIKYALQLENGINHVCISANYAKLTPADRASCLRNGLDVGVWTIDSLDDAITQANTSTPFITTDNITQDELYAGYTG